MITGKPIAAMVCNWAVRELLYLSTWYTSLLTCVIANVAPKPISSIAVNIIILDFRTRRRGSEGEVARRSRTKYNILAVTPEERRASEPIYH